MATLTALLDGTRNLLANAGETQHSDTSLTLYLNWALNDLVAYVATPSDVEYDGDGSTTTFTIPDNCYEIDLVHVEDEGYVAEIKLRPGVDIPTSNVAMAYQKRGSSIIFNEAPGSGKAVTIYYDGYYTELVDGGMTEIPRWAQEAVCYYAASSALAGKSAGAASIDQWDQQWDSGNPEHNPLARVAESYYASYLRIVTDHTHDPEIETWS